MPSIAPHQVTVVDAFLGSGTTLSGALSPTLLWGGIDPLFVDTAIRRRDAATHVVWPHT
jgi:hypothetical protein